MPRMSLLKKWSKGEKETKCYLVQHGKKKENQLDKYEQEYKYALRQSIKWFMNFPVHLDYLVFFILWPTLGVACPRLLPLTSSSPSEDTCPDLTYIFYASSGRDGQDAQCLETAQGELTLLCSASMRSMSSWASILNAHNLSITKWDGKGDGPNCILYFDNWRLSQKITLCNQSLGLRVLNWVHLS